jgi:branched-subunit amino acid ABC-type transport system permease component
MFRLIVMVGAFLAVWPAVAKQWREDRAGFWKTVWLMLAYVVCCALGVALTFALLIKSGKPNDTEALALTFFVLGWILYGARWLGALVPAYRQVPSWLQRRFGVVDVVMPLFILGCLAVAITA